MLRLYRTRVPAPAWQDPDGRALLLDRSESEERRLIGYDESLFEEGVVLAISADK